MYNVVDNIYIGTADEVNFAKQYGYSILGVCKEPLHRQNARIRGHNKDGYTGRAMDKNEPEYLFAKRDHALYCNFIDTQDSSYIPLEAVNECMNFLDEEIIYQDRKVLIACNKGESRSPSIALMWLVKQGYFDDEVYTDFE